MCSRLRQARSTSVDELRHDRVIFQPRGELMEFAIGVIAGVLVLIIGIMIGAALTQGANKKTGGTGFNAN